MKRVTCLGVALLLPGTAGAAASGAGGAGLFSGLLQMIASLAVVLGLICLLSHFAKRWQSGSLTGRRHPGHIRILESRHLSPKKTLLLVEVAGEYLLLGSGGEGIQLIKQIDMLEEIEIVEVLGEKPAVAGGFQERLEGFLGRVRGCRIGSPVRGGAA